MLDVLFNMSLWGIEIEIDLLRMVHRVLEHTRDELKLLALMLKQMQIQSPEIACHLLIKLALKLLPLDQALSLKVLGTVATSDNPELLKALTQQGYLQEIDKLLDQSHSALALWSLSNYVLLCAVEAISVDSILRKVCRLMSSHLPQVAVEAGWVIVNIVALTDSTQI